MVGVVEIGENESDEDRLRSHKHLAAEAPTGVPGHPPPPGVTQIVTQPLLGLEIPRFAKDVAT